MVRPTARRLLAHAAAVTLAASAGIAALTITSAPAHADGALNCMVSNRRTTDTIRVRQQPTTTSAIVATLAPAGATIDSARSECHYHRHSINSGSRYTCFGHPEDNTWVRVSEDGEIGYVGWRCVTGP